MVYHTILVLFCICNTFVTLLRPILAYFYDKLYI